MALHKILLPQNKQSLLRIIPSSLYNSQSSTSRLTTPLPHRSFSSSTPPKPQSDQTPIKPSSLSPEEEKGQLKAAQKAKRKELRNKLIEHITDSRVKKLFYTSMALVFVSKSLAIASPWFLKGVVDSMIVANSAGSVMNMTNVSLGIGAFGLCRFFSTLFQEVRMSQVSEMILRGTRRISLNAFSNLHKLDIDFHKTSAKNTVFALNRAVKSIETGSRFLFGFFTPIAFEFLLLCGVLSIVCGPKYLLNMMVTLGLYTYFSKTFSEVRRVQMSEKKDADKKAEFFLNESVMNYEAVKTFGNEPLEKKRYTNLLNDFYKISIKVQASLGQLNVGQTVIFSSGMVFNLIMAANDVSLGLMTPGDFILVQAYFMQLSGPLFNMGMMFREIGQTQVDMEDLLNMLDKVPKVQDKADAKPFEFKEGAIEFKDISFGHKKDDGITNLNNLFNDLSLRFEPGSTNAIVGPSGFGKTTILHLIFRMYDPDNGKVLIDGQDVSDMQQDTFREHISVVPQTGILFNDTIEFNLRYGNPDASQEEIENVAKKCRIHDKIMDMNGGYNAQVGDLGSKLSGGERQRILMARGLLKKNAKIFLFDEATSSLDAQTEKEITEELDEFMVGKTVVYCAHRLSSIINVDKIHVVANGRVQEQGTHVELMANSESLYSQMWSDYLREQKEIV